MNISNKCYWPPFFKFFYFSCYLKMLFKFTNFIHISWYIIREITKLPNTEQSSKGKVKTHKSTNRQNNSFSLKTKNKHKKNMWIIYTCISKRGRNDIIMLLAINKWNTHPEDILLVWLFYWTISLFPCHHNMTDQRPPGDNILSLVKYCP